MEAFSLLKYWKGGGGGAAAAAAAAALAATDTNSNSNSSAAAILTAVAQNHVETDDDSDSDTGDDDGPFFDLEFTLPDDSEDSPRNLNEDHTASDSENHSEEQNQENIGNNANEDSEVDDDDEGESESEIKFTLSPSSNERSDDPNLSDEVVFKGELVQLEPSSFVLNSSEPNSKPQFTASLLKSATKFRVFMLGLKKPKPNNNSTSEKDPNGSDPAAPNLKHQRKLFTVKFKVEEVPIMSLFTRDNSSKGAKPASASASASSASSTSNKDEAEAEAEPETETETETGTETQTQTQTEAQSLSYASEEKRSMQKYLRMVKPLYVKVSRRYAEKLRFSGQLNTSDSAAAEKPAVAKAATEKEGDVASEALGKGQKQGNLPLHAGLRVVCKHLGKSRSASSVALPAAPPAPSPAGSESSRRRDDSLLQQQDGIQGAILHCKRSFNASRECESSSQLPRSVSDPLHEVSPELSRKSINEMKAITNAPP